MLAVTLNRCKLVIKIKDKTYTADDYVGLLIIDEKFCKYPRKLIGVKRLDFEKIELMCNKPVILIDKHDLIMRILTSDGEFVIPFLKILDYLSETHKII